MASQEEWQQLTTWWTMLAQRHKVAEKAQEFFQNGIGPNRALERADREGGDLDYILFIFIRHWIPPVLPSTRSRAKRKKRPRLLGGVRTNS